MRENGRQNLASRPRLSRPGMNNWKMFPASESSQSGTSLGPSLVDGFAEFWRGGNGPNHAAIDRKIAAAGLPIGEGPKERKIIDAFMAANNGQAEVLMRGLLDALRQFAEGPYGQGPLGGTKAGVRLREAIESAGFSLSEDFKIIEPSQATVPGSQQVRIQPWPSLPGGSQQVRIQPWPSLSGAQATHQMSVGTITARDKVEIHEAESPKTPPRDIFLVHGHDESVLYKVSHWVQELTGVKPIILSNQINKGNTLIEKFENSSSDSACAVVLMTPDDEARAKRDASSALLGRARQNVVFELGYFYGKLKRENVIVLNFGVELPGDINGLVYIGESNWQVDLGKELAGLGYSAHL